MSKKYCTPTWKTLQRGKKNIILDNNNYYYNNYNNVEEKDDDYDDDDDKNLEVQFKDLQQFWDSVQSKPPGRIIVPKQRCCSSDTKCTVGKSLHLLDNSPKKLMSALQNRPSLSPPPGGGVWKVRTNDFAVEEILRERRAAIESGKLKGRRLFCGMEMEGATEMDLGYSDWSGFVLGNGGRKSGSLSASVSSASTGIGGDDNSGSYCCGCSECGGGDDKERKKVTAAAATEESLEEKRDGNGRRWRVLVGRFCIALIVLILCFIIIILLTGDGAGDEGFLVPT